MDNTKLFTTINVISYDNPKLAHILLNTVLQSEVNLNQVDNIIKKTIQVQPNIKHEIYLKRLEQLDYLYYLDLLKKNNISFITYESNHYPDLLKEIAFPPLVLYYKGKIEYLRDPQIAVVGPRKNSSYGKEVCETFCKNLLPYFRILSGLASGIDSIAHHTALNKKQATIAVIGNGLNHIYPKNNQDLYKKIIENGVIISEYPPNTTPKPFYFPQRNRIVSGLSQGVLVCEASEKSGSLVTANLALEQNREVFVVPGSIFSEYSTGTNKLIQQGALCTTSVKDILQELNIKNERFIITQSNATNLTTKANNPILAFFSKTPISIETLLSQTNLPLPNLLHHITLLESAESIKKLPGNNYIIND